MTKSWDEVFTGYVIVDAAVVDDFTFVLTANWDETHKDPDDPGYGNRLLFCSLENGWGGKHMTPGFLFARTTGGRHPDGHPQALFASASGAVVSFEFPDGPRQQVEPMPVAGAKNLTFIGEHFYSFGLHQVFQRRNRPDDWTVLSEEEDGGTIKAVVGFAEDDMYLAVHRYEDGALSQMLHWDGQNFIEIPLPKTAFEGTPWNPLMPWDMCTAPDGRVFLSGNDGELFVGNKTGFVQLVQQVERHMGAMNICWFKDTLYGTQDAGLFTFDFDELRWKGAPFVGDPHAPVHFGYIDANENVMIVAGGFGAAIFDGTHWTRIAGDVEAIDITRLQLMEQQLEDIRDLRDIMKALAEDAP